MKALERNGLLLLLSAAGLVVAADSLDLPWLTSMALIGVGLMACLGGTRVITRGEVFEGRSRWGDPRFVGRHTGISARLIGAVLLIGGPLVAALGAMEFSGPGRASGFLAGLLETPYGWAIILGVPGLMVTAMGIARSLSGSAMPRGTRNRHVELGIKVGGAISALAGLAMLFLAAGLVLVPDLPQKPSEQLKQMFEQAVRLVEAWMLSQ